MKSTSLMYAPFSLFMNDIKQDLSDIKFEKASKGVIIYRYAGAILIALLFINYPYVCHPFIFEGGAMKHYRLESVLAGNLDVQQTIIRCLLVYGYTLFLCLVFYVKRIWLKALNLAFFAFFIAFSVHNHHAVDILLAIRAAGAWYFLMYFFKDFLNKNYKNLLYSPTRKIVYLQKENDNVSVWRAMFFSAVIIALQVFIIISLFYSQGGAI